MLEKEYKQFCYIPKHDVKHQISKDFFQAYNKILMQYFKNPGYHKIEMFAYMT